MSWVEKNPKINNRGGAGTIIPDSRVTHVLPYHFLLVFPINSFMFLKRESLMEIFV